MLLVYNHSKLFFLANPIAQVILDGDIKSKEALKTVITFWLLVVSGFYIRYFRTLN